MELQNALVGVYTLQLGWHALPSHAGPVKPGRQRHLVVAREQFPFPLHTLPAGPVGHTATEQAFPIQPWRQLQLPEVMSHRPLPPHT
jgi:hypothetical protein